MMLPGRDAPGRPAPERRQGGVGKGADGERVAIPDGALEVDLDDFRTRMVALLGPPGIGKTRLAEEFLDFALLEDARMASARKVHAEESIEWEVVGELARQLYRLPGAWGIGTPRTVCSGPCCRRWTPDMHQSGPQFDFDQSLPDPIDG